jgi:hypothetical protein
MREIKPHFGHNIKTVHIRDCSHWDINSNINFNINFNINDLNAIQKLIRFRASLMFATNVYFICDNLCQLKSHSFGNSCSSTEVSTTQLSKLNDLQNFEFIFVKVINNIKLLAIDNKYSSNKLISFSLRLISISPHFFECFVKMFALIKNIRII